MCYSKGNMQTVLGPFFHVSGKGTDTPELGDYAGDEKIWEN